MLWIKAITAPIRLAAGTFDAALIAHTLPGYTSSANHLYHAGFGITVLGRCASLYELPFVAAWFVASWWFCQRKMTKNMPAWLVAAIIASVMLTEIRLALCASSYARYEWWHNGPGNTIYTAVAMFSVIGLAGKWTK